MMGLIKEHFGKCVRVEGDLNKNHAVGMSVRRGCVMLSWLFNNSMVVV